MIQAAGGHHGDINGAVSAFISRLAGTQVTGPVLDNPDAGPPPSSQPTNYAQPRNYAFAWAFLWVFVGFVILGIIITLAYTIAEGRRAKAKDRELAQDRINRARKDVDRLAHEVLKGKDVSAEQNSAEQNSAAMSVGTA
jgi:flagellar biosynthesis/type III secretory pathway M-ring protein FliF/YscJ